MAPNGVRGFEWISVWDHFYAADATFADGKVTSGSVCLEAVATTPRSRGATSSVRCGSLVYSVGYRHPAVLANTIATIDHLSGGRAVLGLGRGLARGGVPPYGIPFPPAPVRLRLLDEAIQCVRLLLTEDTASFQGEFFELADARCDPKPVQQRLPLWIGGAGEKVTLRIAARHADGGTSRSPRHGVPAQGRSARGPLHRAAKTRLGSTKSVNLAVAADDSVLEGALRGTADYIRPSALMGSPQQMVDRIGEYADAGADMVILALRAPFDLDELDRFAADVLPNAS